MILQALAKQYEALAAEGKIAEPGWCDAKVSLAAELSETGKLVRLLPLSDMNGNKERPRIMKVPEQVKKTSGIAANFLCDSCEYIFGLDLKDKPERARQCFEASRKKHHEILDGLDSAGAKSILLFFDGWDPVQAAQDPILMEYEKTIRAGGSIVFFANGRFAQEDPDIRQKWSRYRDTVQGGADTGICLVTGEELPIARLHDNIKGIRGAQSSGASLVSYNAPAFESYGFTQGENATVSTSVMLEYTKALNYMLSHREYVQQIGETTIVFWAEHAAALPQTIVRGELFDLWDNGEEEDDSLTEKDVQGILKDISKGRRTTFRNTDLSPDDRFYLLGISPNAARLSVRFYCEKSFGRLLDNLISHHERLKIAKPVRDEEKRLSLWHMLNETANQKSKDKNPPSPMAGAVFMSILDGTGYPAALYGQIMLRIRAEHDISWRKAAIIKAYLLNKRNTIVPKEVLQVALNEDATYRPYVLGELFALLEKVQEDSAGLGKKVNSTIKDKYFTSACTTPGRIFPLLLSLSSHHQKKLSDASKVFYDKELCGLMAKLGSSYPMHLSLEEQGAFYLGYYQKRQSLFAKKSDEKMAEGEE
ncbi:MAG: type I-C CRISPR-associated protein Cas8c/Csd1 [Blautia sp.]|nr:type I-C CRISPR-associated protein Cas8c/Csd1 [Blautia sp.]MBR2527836.1 type I-C CRISPR-associated protein Cas8c/Csd1 [Blautia sp.]